jgi:hypothetical protein
VSGLTKTVIRVAPCGRGGEKPATVRKGGARSAGAVGGRDHDREWGATSTARCLEHSDR